MDISSITGLIGNTPLVELTHLHSNPRVRVLLKLEGQNPGGSVKDRPVLFMLNDAEKTGKLYAGKKIIEPTSGNTGIALAMISAAKGYDIELVMPENATLERVQQMRAFGAKVTLTPAQGSMEATIDYANEKVHQYPDDYFMPNQFANPANWQAHYHTTGPEIWKATDGKVTHFVSAMGTTGTIMGVSRYLKEKNPAIQIIGLRPEEGASIPGIRRWPLEYLPKIFDPQRVDIEMDMSQEVAEQTARTLAHRASILAGVSAGGNVAAALKIAEQLDEGVIVTVMCDRGERYLSANLF